MKQKGFLKIALAIAIILVFAVGYFIWRKTPSSTVTPASTQQSPTAESTVSPSGNQTPLSVSDDNFSTDIDGYITTCMDNQTIYKNVNGSWEEASDKLPESGLYYLDDKFVGYGMCDSLVCSKLSNPYTIQLVEYKKIGEKSPPSNSGSAASTLPAYQTVPLRGNIKIDIQYFSDKNCQDKKTFSTVVRR